MKLPLPRTRRVFIFYMEKGSGEGVLAIASMN